MKQRILVGVTTLVILGATSIGVASTFAQDTSPVGSLVDKIATRFNLNKDEVQKVFDEEKSARHAQMKANLEAKLNQAVTDGKITEAQKSAILTKFGEPKIFTKKIESGQEVSKEEMDKLREEKKTEMENWAKENGLSPETLQGVLGGNKGFGHRMMMFKAQ